MSPGISEQDMRRQGLRTSGWLRFVVVVVASLVALFMDTAREPLVSLGFMLGVNGWNVWYAIRMRRGAGMWLVTGDVVVMSALCLAQPWVIAPDATVQSTSWVTVTAAMILVVYPWYVRTAVFAVVTGLITAAYLVGAARALPGDPLGLAPVGLWLVIESTLSWGLLLLVRRGSRAADRLVDRGEQLRRDAEIAAARRIDEREYLAALHDTASATLMIVGSGVVKERQEWLAEQAARDLEVMSGPAVVARSEVDLLPMLRDVIRHTPLTVGCHAPSSLRVPAVTAVALSHGTREALTNVVRHAEVGLAEVTAYQDGDMVVVEVADQGKGFDPEHVDGHRYGVTRSLKERMVRSGGSAQVFSKPGEGTRVRMECTLVEPNSPVTDDTEVFASKFLDAIRWAVIAFNPVILFGLVLPRMLKDLDSAYSSVAAQFFAWGGLMAVSIWMIVAMWRGGLSDRWRWPLVGLVFALSIVATAWTRPEYRLTVAHWAEGDAVWIMIGPLIGTAAGVFVGVAGVHYLTMFLYSLIAGQVVVSMASAVNAAVITFGLQLAVGWIAFLVRMNAGTTARLARDQERVRTMDAVAEQLHKDRTERYAGLAKTVVPLLAGLASNELDPGDPQVRRACAVEAARMRRLFAEDATVPDQLVHELRACIEVAERNGVSVSFAAYGSRPAVPTSIRRTLIEPAAAAVATARTKVRLTVVGADETVTVSVVADCPPVPVVSSSDIVTSSMADGEVLWIQASWRSDTAAHSPGA